MQVCALRAPNALSGDTVQAALECAKGIQLRLTWREPQGGGLRGVQYGEQHLDATLLDCLAQLSSTLTLIGTALTGFDDMLGCGISQMVSSCRQCICSSSTTSNTGLPISRSR